MRTLRHEHTGQIASKYRHVSIAQIHELQVEALITQISDGMAMPTSMIAFTEDAPRYMAIGMIDDHTFSVEEPWRNDV